MSDLSYLTAENIIVVPLDLDNNPVYSNILIQNNIHQVTMPASLTKLLSVLVALESGYDLMEQYKVIESDIVSGSGYNLKVNDKITLIDLLYNMMLPSSNIAANCVARTIGEKMGGNYQFFIDAMNEKAKSIGMLSSIFYNPSGLAHGKQLSTPFDLSLLGTYACKNSKLLEIWSKAYYELNISGNSKRVEKIRSSVMGILDHEPWALGGKTGSLGGLYNIIMHIKLNSGLKALVVTTRSSSSDGRAFDAQIIAKYCNAQF